MIGHANVACMCCCKEDNAKCAGTTMIVLNSLAFIGSFVDFFFYALLTAVCDGYDIEDHPACKFVAVALAWNIMCTILRIVAIVMASLVSCCRPARINMVNHVALVGVPQVQQGVPMATYSGHAPGV